MKRKITEEYVDQQLKFAVQVALGIDMLVSHENAFETVQAVISQILIALGYSQQESYGAAVTLQVTGVTKMINESELSVSLPALVSMGSKVIRDKKIPDFVKLEVERTLANEGQ